MARPLWLKLFGRDGPSTLAEFRSALLTAPIGQAVAADSFVTSIRSLLSQPVWADRPVMDPGRDPAPREQFQLTLTVLQTPAIVVGPDGPVIDWAAALAEPGPQDAGELLAGLDSERTTSVHLNGVINDSLASVPRTPLNRLDTSVPLALLGDLQTGLVIDTRGKTLMQGGPGDYPGLFAGKNDILELEGDYSSGVEVAVPAMIEQLILHAGDDYNLILGDDAVAAGDRLTINAMPLTDANRLLFDGSAETDGSFLFYGSESNDHFLGGAGDDVLWGMGGGDLLSGGGGNDVFAYHDAAHSSGTGYDTLADFDPGADKIDLEVEVAGFDAAIESGTLSAGSFDSDLSAALAGLGAGRAVLYAPDAGDLAGKLFLVVDANGVAGYQEGEDYVFALAGTTLADLGGHTDFFI